MAAIYWPSCQENLVYSCGIHEGISHKLLCPFHYFGVPDDVDYRNIPWRELSLRRGGSDGGGGNRV